MNDLLRMWSICKENFERDDGTLPTIELTGLTGSQVVEAYKNIRSSSELTSQDFEFWDNGKAASVRLVDASDVADLVVRGAVPYLRFSIQGVRVHGQSVPVLGVQVFKDAIEIDYKMGEAWNPVVVDALFGWLKEIVPNIKVATFGVGDIDPPPHPNSLIEAWEMRF